MRKLYLDETEAHECMSIFMKDAEIIRAGTTVYSMPVKEKNAEYEKFADEYDIYFIFDDDIPRVDFYTIPQVDIMATDSQGGFIGTIGQMTDLEGDAPICYIDHERNCYLAAENAKDFIKCAPIWKNCLKEYHGVTFYQSKSDAEKVVEFIDRNDIGKSLVRYATKEDVSRIAELLVFGKRVAYRTIFNNDVDSFKNLQVLDVIKEYQSNPYLLENTLLYDDGIVKGIIGKRVSVENQDEIELCDFYVEPVFQGMGIGRKLISHLIREAKAEGRKRIFLWVIKDNLSARKFYELNGFIADGQEKLIDGTQILDKRYVKEL